MEGDRVSDREDHVTVTEDGFWVALTAGTSYEEIEPVSLTPDEADAVALRLTRAAAAARTQRAIVEMLCRSEGHQWGEGIDGRPPDDWQNGRIHVRNCNRCGERLVAQGWLNDYPPRKHRRPVGYHWVEVDCYGPGCPDCEGEEVGAAFGRLLGDAKTQLTGDPS